MSILRSIRPEIVLKVLFRFDNEKFRNWSVICFVLCMNQENKHFVSLSIINKRKNILCKRFYSSFDQNSRLLNVFVSFRNRISSISKLYYRRTFMIVDIPSVESGEKAIFNVFIFLMFLYSADEENIFSSRQKWSLWIIQNLKNVKDSPRLHKAIHKYYTSMTVYWSKHYFPKTIIEMSIDVH